MPEIIVSIKDREIARFPVMRTWMTIGRDESNDMAIDNESVSRFHAALSFSDTQGFVVEDMGSSNGITVNGNPTQRATISPGDRVGVGKYSLTLSNTGGVSLDQLVAVKPTAQPNNESLARRTYMMPADVVVRYQQKQPPMRTGSQARAPQPIARSTPWGWMLALAVLLLALAGVVVALVI